MAAKKNIATKVACQRVDRNPHMADDKWKADHWKCTVARKGKRMSVYFSKGYGHGGVEPTSGEIVEAMASDASGMENSRGFED